MKKMKRFSMKMEKCLLLTLTICFLSQVAFATPINDLFSGESYQFSNLLLNNWELVTASNVNLNNIDIGAGYNSDEFGVWGLNRELWVGTTSYTPIIKRLSFDFKVTGLGVDITQVKGDLGVRSVSGFNSDTPWIRGRFDIGTSKGSNDLGSATEIFSLNQDTNTPWLNMPDGLNEIWVRNTIVLDSSPYGYARAGYYSGISGPALLTEFSTQATTTVPEPSTIFLLGTGLAILAGTRMRK
jgi:PEP-CTERM motif